MRKKWNKKKIKSYRNLLSIIFIVPVLVKYLILALRADWSPEKNRAMAPHLQHLLIKKTVDVHNECKNQEVALIFMFFEPKHKYRIIKLFSDLN